MNDTPLQPKDFERCRRERVGRLIERKAFAPLHSGVHTVLHVIPLRCVAVGETQFEDTLSILHEAGQLRPLFATSAFELKHNRDGSLIHSTPGKFGLIGSYLQVFRDGALESVNTLAERDRTLYGKQIPFLEIELQLLRCLPGYFVALQRLGVRPPVALGLTLFGIEGYWMETPSNATFGAQQRGRRIHNDTLLLPTVTAPTFGCNLSELLRPALDAAWRAFGHDATIGQINMMT